MPAPYGLTPEGLSRPTFEEVCADLQQRVWKAIAPTMDLSDSSLEGQIIAIVAEVATSLWELGEVAVGAGDSEAATDAGLDAVCILTGTTRRSAYASTSLLTMTGDDATPIPVSSAARVPGGVQFETLSAGILALLDAWAPTTLYGLGARVSNAGNAYQAVAAGTSAGSGGPTTEASSIVDGDVEWRFLGEGVAAIDIPSRASATGPLIANSGTITEIVTPVGGWNGVTNVLDAVPGSARMNDATLRVLRLLELARQGSGSIDAIEADLIDESKVPGVTAVTVFDNPNDTVTDGMPPHSVEAMVQGGEPQAIWNQLLKSVGGGIRTHGTEVGTAADRRGRLHTMKFTRATEKLVYVSLTVERDPTTFPDDGVDLIKQAIVDWGNAQAAGKNAVASRIAAAAFVDDSILDAGALIGLAPDPSTGTTIQIGTREVAKYDTSRIDITFVDGTP